MGIAASLCGVRKEFQSQTTTDYQKDQIMRELRRNKNDKGKTLNNIIKKSKIAPITISVQQDHYDCKYNTDDPPLGNRRNSDQSLKSALTHPTILNFLYSFMIAQSTDRSLDFYLDVVKILDLDRKKCYRESYNLWLLLVPKYVSVNATHPMSIGQSMKNEICGKLLNSAQGSESRSPIARIRDTFEAKRIDKRIIDMLELAQNEVFLSIKLDSWRPFCKSDIFISLLGKKEIRTTVAISQEGNGFESVYSSKNSSQKTENMYAASFRSSLRSMRTSFFNNNRPGGVDESSIHSFKTSRMSMNDRKSEKSSVNSSGRDSGLYGSSSGRDSGLYGSRYCDKNISVDSQIFNAQLFETTVSRGNERRSQRLSQRVSLNESYKHKEYKDDLNDRSQSINNSTRSVDNWKDSSLVKERLTGNSGGISMDNWKDSSSIKGYTGGISIAEFSAVKNVPGNLSSKEHSFDDKECSCVDNFWEGMADDDKFQSNDSAKVRKKGIQIQFSGEKLTENDIIIYRSSDIDNTSEKAFKNRDNSAFKHRDDSFDLDNFSEKSPINKEIQIAVSEFKNEYYDFININEKSSKNEKSENENMKKSEKIENESEKKVRKNVNLEFRNERNERRSNRNSAEGISWRDNYRDKRDSAFENKAHLSAVALEKRVNDHFMKIDKSNYSFLPSNP
mmetsp:Transcript_557/g.633  ORF Transcript_557/g.633 Transcript_557/m.633 type:complete len:675 (+) Transcript_557:319-2343(+)